MIVNKCRGLRLTIISIPSINASFVKFPGIYFLPLKLDNWGLWKIKKSANVLDYWGISQLFEMRIVWKNFQEIKLKVYDKNSSKRRSYQVGTKRDDWIGEVWTLVTHCNCIYHLSFYGFLEIEYGSNKLIKFLHVQLREGKWVHTN